MVGDGVVIGKQLKIINILIKNNTLALSMKLFLISLFISSLLHADCALFSDFNKFSKKISKNTLIYYSNDTRRNLNSLKKLCVYEINFIEGPYNWKMLLVINPLQEKGPFWFLPHDDENSAFDTAVYSSIKYGGGFLAIESNDKRYFHKQDPNRNFGTTPSVADICTNQKYPAPKYTNIIFNIIDYFKTSNMPYLALHNNKDGWYKNGGSGSVSILNSTRQVQSFKISDSISSETLGFLDEDNLVYIAGSTKQPPQDKINTILAIEINVKYEVVNKKHNDCSLSNYIVLNKNTNDYFNIESQHGDTNIQKAMVNKLMNFINRRDTIR